MKRTLFLLVLSLISPTLSAGLNVDFEMDEDPDWTWLDKSETAAQVESYESPLIAGLDLEYSPITYSSYTFDGTTVATLANGFFASVEWFVVPLKYGKLGVGFGAGGILMSPNVTGLTGSVLTSSLAIPIHAGISYRLDLMPNQILVPLVRASGAYSLVFESASGGSLSKSAIGITFGGGVEFLLDRIDPSSAHGFDRSVGVNNTFLIAEYLIHTNLVAPSGLNLSRNEIRLGIRFEM